jgi:hypothetical protein
MSTATARFQRPPEKQLNPCATAVTYKFVFGCSGARASIGATGPLTRANIKKLAEDVARGHCMNGCPPFGPVEVYEGERKVYTLSQRATMQACAPLAAPASELVH